MLNESRLRALPTLTPVEARFWSKVHIVDDDESCWEWQASRTIEGYGTFSWKHPDSPFSNGRAGAHRVAFYLINGFTPEHTCHTCDNPPCVRPSHLFAGTQIENIADRTRKGRSAGTIQRGSLNNATHLTEADVEAIKVRLGRRESHHSIAADFGITRATVSQVARGFSWSHVEGPDVPAHGARSRLTNEVVLEIRRRADEGERQARLAEEYGVHQATISKIVAGHTWRHLL